MISVILPVYNRLQELPLIHRRLKEIMSSLNESYEIIVVDDGSTDGTRKKLASLSPVTVVMLSRHFGRNSALDAGFQKAIGDFVLTVGDEGETGLESLPLLVEKLKEGYGTVVGWRRKRRLSFFRKIFSKLANWFIGRATGVKIHDFSCSLKGYRREFIDGVQLLGDTFMFMPVFAHDRGAKVAEVEINHQSAARESFQYSLKEIIFMLFDLLSVKFLLNYFAKPLRFFGSWALFFISLSFLSVAGFLSIKFGYLTSLNPTSFLLIAVMFMILGFLVFTLGFITEILLRIYYANKDTAQYMIYEVIKNK